MPHLHLSIQHGNDLILKRMKRRHLARDVVRFVEQARKNRPGIVLGADFISGFPTENGEAHLSSLKLINDLEICWGHIFPYSPRNGSPAAKMPQIESKLRKDRAKEVGDINNFPNILDQPNNPKKRDIILPDCFFK